MITGQDGSIVGTDGLWAYGEPVNPTESYQLQRFTGHERDYSPDGRTFDLDYMHARHCVPYVGRFMSVDPAKQSQNARMPQSWNRYAYALGNPMRYVDPDGLSAKNVHVAHTRHVLSSRGFGSNTADIVARANLRSDTFLPYRVHTPNHATAIFLPDAAANRRGERFAQKKLAGAIRAAKRGNLRKALKRLGRALHAAEDVVAHRGLGNVSVTLVQHLASGLDGDRMTTHSERDASLVMTPGDDPMTSSVLGVANDEIHQEIIDRLQLIVDEFIQALDGRQLETIKE